MCGVVSDYRRSLEDNSVYRAKKFYRGLSIVHLQPLFHRLARYLGQVDDLVGEPVRLR